MVRFCASHWLGGADTSAYRPWLVGLLIEYHSWEKMATIMYKGEIIRVQARLAEKAGAKDFEGR